MAVANSVKFVKANSQYGSISDASQTGLDLTTDYTIEFWMRITKLPVTTNATLVSKDQVVTNQRPYWVDIEVSAAKFRASYYDSSNNNTRGTMNLAFTSADVGVWNHLAVATDISASTFTFYKNGELQGTTYTAQAATTIVDYATPFYIGASHNNGSPTAFADEQMRNVRVWNDIRTQDEIRENMNVDTPADVTGLQGNWLMNGDLTDSSSNGNDLVASGSPTYPTDYPDIFDITENTNTGSVHKITIDNTKIPGSTDLTERPILLSDSNFLSSLYASQVSIDIASSSLAADGNLQAHYKLEDVTDTSSNGYDLTNNGTVTFTTGKFDNAGDFEDGSSQYLSIADASCPALEIAGNKTISCWVKPETVGGSWRYIWSKFHNVNQEGWRLANIANGNFRLQNRGTSDEALHHPYFPAVGEWCFIVAIHDRTENLLKLFINGEWITTPTAQDTPDSNADFVIGANSGDTHTEHFDGMIDDLAVFDRVLTEAEVSELYREGSQLRFSEDEAGTIQLASELVNFDAAGETGNIIIKPYTISHDADTDIYVHFDNDGIGRPRNNGPFGTHQVWVSDYRGSLRLQEHPNTLSNFYRDSTDIGNHFTGVSMALARATGKFGYAQDLDGTADYIAYTATDPIMSPTTATTISLWMSADTDTGAMTPISTSDTGGDIDYWSTVLQDQGGIYNHQVRAEISASGRRIAGTTTEITTSTWFYVTITSDGSTYSLYVNGTLQSKTVVTGSDDGVIWGDVTGRDNVVIGVLKRTGLTQYFNGQIQEVRIKRTIDTADEILMEYNNMNDPASFAIASALNSGVGFLPII